MKKSKCYIRGGCRDFSNIVTLNKRKESHRYCVVCGMNLFDCKHEKAKDLSDVGIIYDFCPDCGDEYDHQNKE